MNREIKFRAWSKESNCFVQSGVQFNNTKMELEAVGVELMQYTGLKDKNGKEIYEGDIIGWDYFCESEKIRRTSVVNFEKGCFECNDYDRPDFVERKVIGNIYENPELLANH